jgi:hypothetical protein
MAVMGSRVRAVRTAAAVLATAALLVSAGCSGILGVEEVSVDPALAGGLTVRDDGNGGACEFARDCADLETTPPRCAAAECVGGKCLYRASDSDQDGYRAARCGVPAGIQITLGDDCDDADPQLFPGQEADCAFAPDGTPIAFPNGQPTGACKYGKRACNADGTVSACTGAIAPSAPTSCTETIDESCTGNPLEGCACSPGQTTPCGSSAVGQCKKGTSSCGAGGTFGACVANVEPAPRNCGSSEDFDCNGVPDNQEASCQCPGGAAPGATRPCNTHAQDGTGTCKAGAQTCTASGTSAAWSACAGDVGPVTEACDGLDRNCNGVAGVNEPAAAGPGGTMNCAKTYKCNAAGRGPLYYRTGIGWTNYAGSGTLWTGYVPRGSYAAGTYPPGTYRISRDSSGTKMGPVAVSSTCCGASGCPNGNILFDSQGQFYTPAP